MSDSTFAIYQVKEGMDKRAVRFVPLEQLRAAGLSVDWDNYNHLYTGTLKSDAAPALETLNTLFETFNAEPRPADFTGRSLSVGDIVVLHRDGKAAATMLILSALRKHRSFCPRRIITTRPSGLWI